jgi:hypothetical protein
MTVAKVSPSKIEELIDAVAWTRDGDATTSAQEARRRAQISAPDCIALLAHVVRTDGYASVAQRVRSATVLLEAAELLASERSKPTGLFRAEGADGAGEREAS